MTETSERQETCGNCKFWERWGSEFGGCHRSPPLTDFRVEGRESEYQRIQIAITKSHNPVWPNTSQADWCGEHRGASQ